MQHDTVVDYFARAAPGDTEQMLRELLRTDEAKVISVMAELSQRRAEIIIAPLAGDFPWLSDLPRAAAAMAAHATTLGLEDLQAPVQLKRAVTERGWMYAYVRYFEGGVMYWRPSGVCTVTGVIAEYHNAMGGPDGVLGFPSVKKLLGGRSTYETTGLIQDFEDANVCSSHLGTHAVVDEFFEIYKSLDRVSGWLGFPISECEPYDDARTQRFEGGTIYSSARGTFPVRKAINELISGWIPIAQEMESGKSPVSGRGGTSQSFRGTGGGRLMVYSSIFGTYPVGWNMLRYYQQEGGPTSRLGFPVAKHQIISGKGSAQMFEGGCVYLPLFSRSAVTVPRSTVHLLTKDIQITELLGWPTTEEEGPGEAGTRVQFFENGVVTRKSASSEIWLRPQ